MSTSKFSRLVVGIIVESREELEPDRSKRVECCGEIYRYEKAPKYCPECGTKTGLVKHPPETAYEKWHKHLPMALCEEQGIFDVSQAVSDGYTEGSTWVLGVVLGETKASWTGERRPVSFSLVDVDRAMSAVVEIAQRCGVKGMPHLFLSTVVC